MTRKTMLIALVAVVSLVATACGGGDGTQATPTATPETTATPQAAGDEPVIEIPDGDPPAELVIEDISEGEGAEVQAGGTVTAHYVGVSWSTGEEFDSSWDRGEPVTFPLDQVIEGWQEGIPGMKVGGRRRLVIPPDKGYGDNPPPGSGIAPGETLVFVVDLVAIAPS